MDLKQTLKILKLNEDKIGLFLGLSILIIATIFIYSNNIKSTKDTLTGISTSLEEEGKTTYTVKKGDTLWKIAIEHYQDGSKWTQIATQNNLSNPSLIHQGNILVIPLK